MAYATLQQLTDRYGERMLINLTDRGDVATDTIDTDAVDRAIADTQAVIDGYLAGRYALPLESVPDLVADIAQAIAIYKLHVVAADPKIETDYKDAIKALEKIASGMITLEVAGVEPAGSGSSGVQVTDRDRPMTAANLKGFI